MPAGIRPAGLRPARGSLLLLNSRCLDQGQRLLDVGVILQIGRLRDGVQSGLRSNDVGQGGVVDVVTLQDLLQIIHVQSLSCSASLTTAALSSGPWRQRSRVPIVEVLVLLPRWLGLGPVMRILRVPLRFCCSGCRGGVLLDGHHLEGKEQGVDVVVIAIGVGGFPRLIG